jgi:polysaccharide biosynthesis protein PslG
MGRRRGRARPPLPGGVAARERGSAAAGARARHGGRPAALALVAAALLAIPGCGGDGGGDGAEPRREPARVAPEASASFFGIVAEDVLAGDAAYRRQTLASMRSAGVRLIRQTFHWDRIELSPGQYDFAEYDAYVADVTAAGIDILPILYTPPEFRAPRGPERGTYPPARAADMAAFAERLVRRYGPDGDFWREHPELRERPIGAWQVWNEPNLPVYWPDGPDPEAYVGLLEAVAEGIKAADPNASVVSAGLSESSHGVPFAEYVEGMFEAGAGDALDVFALHAFARDTAGSVGAAETTRELLGDLGSSAPIWITEVGWASGGPRSPFTVGEEGQAERIRTTLSALGRRREELGLRGVIYYSWRDAPIYEGGQDFFGLHTGLLDIEGREKPALAAYRAATRP